MEFLTPLDCQLAMTRDRQYIRDRYVLVHQVAYEEVKKVVPAHILRSPVFRRPDIPRLGVQGGAPQTTPTAPPAVPAAPNQNPLVQLYIQQLLANPYHQAYINHLSRLSNPVTPPSYPTNPNALAGGLAASLGGSPQAQQAAVAQAYLSAHSAQAASAAALRSSAYNPAVDAHAPPTAHTPSPRPIHGSHAGGHHGNGINTYASYPPRGLSQIARPPVAPALNTNDILRLLQGANNPR